MKARCRTIAELQRRELALYRRAIDRILRVPERAGYLARGRIAADAASDGAKLARQRRALERELHEDRTAQFRRRHWGAGYCDCKTRAQHMRAIRENAPKEPTE